MTAYYNEIDPFAAAWLRELIREGHIAEGIVDERSILDVAPGDLAGFDQCHFFAGIGGWPYALRLAGWPDNRPVWTGSCPCQPFSAAGRGGGFADERHLWPAFHHLIAQSGPRIVLGEQVASRDGLAWLDLVQSDLEGSGYACGAVDMCAAGVGAPHIRQRLWWVAQRLADAERDGREMAVFDDAGRRPPGGERQADVAGGGGAHGLRLADADDARPQGRLQRGPGPADGGWRTVDWLWCRDGRWRPVEAGTFPLAHGVPARVGRLRGYGNAIVPQVAAAFIEAVMDVT